MFKNNIKIAFRSLFHQKGYSAINIAGLSISLCVVLLMLAWVQDEWNMDKFHNNSDRLYRLKSTIPLADSELDVFKGIPYPVLAAAEKELPEVEKFIPLGRNFEETVQREDLHFRASGTFGNLAFFEAFSYPILQGDISQLDKKIDAIAISETLAKKFFGNVWQTITLGEIIHIHDIGDFSIAAVYKDFPTASTIQNDFVYSIENHLKRSPWAKRWSNTGMQGALLLKPEADAQLVAQKIETIFKSHQKGDLKKGVLIQPYADDYLYGNFDKQAKVAGGRIEYVQTFGIAALFLLIISSINFVNLATARASKRAKEVGVRKTIGAGRNSLISQFMAEAGVVTLISVGIAILLAEILLPTVRIITDKLLYFDYSQPVFWVTTLSITVLLTLLSGIYPSLVLSAFRPINALKGSISQQKIGNFSFRKGLVSVQFILALLLIVGALGIQQQVDFIQNKNLGINKDNLMVIHQDEKIEKKYISLRNELLNKEGIAKVTSAGPSPINNRASTVDVSWAGKRPDQENITFNIVWTESNFLDAFDIPLSTGKFYREGQIRDSINLVLNEKAVETIGMKDPIGKTITWWGEPRTIIGVVKDFNNQSLYEEIKPMAILLDAEDTGLVYIKAKAGKTKEAIAALQSTFKKVIPELPLHFEFVDEQYQARYKSEVLTGKLAKYFAIIAIFISCLGLFGLATFFAEQKTKEIGIRKILGASIPNLIGLLSKEFLLLVGIGLLVGTPVSYYLLNDWLAKFAYKIDLTWWMFAIPVIAAILIAGLTVSIQAIRAAFINPIQSLKSE